jgi:hypothetical protein
MAVKARSFIDFNAIVSFILTSLFDGAPASKMNEKTKQQFEFIENLSLQDLNLLNILR